LQSGATFFVSSGSVAGQFSPTRIKWPDGTIQVSSPTSGGGSATPGGVSGNVQYNNAGSLGGSNNFQFNGTSVTIVSSVSMTTNGLQTPNLGPGFLDIFMQDAPPQTPIFIAGSSGGGINFYILDREPTNFQNYGAWFGGLKAGLVDRFQQIVSQSRNNYWEANVASTMTFNTDDDIGGGDMVFKPQNAEKFRISAISGNMSIASMTITHASGLHTSSITIDTGGLATQAVCWKTNKTLGYCSNVVGAGGACTCN